MAEDGPVEAPGRLEQALLPGLSGVVVPGCEALSSQQVASQLRVRKAHSASHRPPRHAERLKLESCDSEPLFAHDWRAMYLWRLQGGGSGFCRRAGLGCLGDGLPRLGP